MLSIISLHAMANLVESLRYNPEGRGFDSRCFHWKFFLPRYVPGVDTVSNRNEYQEYFLGSEGGRYVQLTTLPPPCAIVMKSESLSLLEPSGPAQACTGVALSFIIFSTHGHVTYEDFLQFLKLPTKHHRRLSPDALFFYLCLLRFKMSPFFFEYYWCSGSTS